MESVDPLWLMSTSTWIVYLSRLTDSLQLIADALDNGGGSSGRSPSSASLHAGLPSDMRPAISLKAKSKIRFLGKIEDSRGIDST